MRGVGRQLRCHIRRGTHGGGDGRRVDNAHEDSDPRGIRTTRQKARKLYNRGVRAQLFGIWTTQRRRRFPVSSERSFSDFASLFAGVRRGLISV